MSLGLGDLTVPIIGAPMAGGPSTPALAAAVAEAGGLGFLAAGYLPASRVADNLAAARALTGGPLGVNLFVPQPCIATDDQIESYRQKLLPLAQRFGVQPGEPHDDDDGWTAKLELLLDAAPEAVSFTFGCPEPAVLTRFRERGVLTMVTITSRAEAQAAVDAGAEVLVVQGPEAGGHRGIFDPAAGPPTEPLDELLAQTVGFGVPVVAAGGLGDAAAVRRVLDAGAVAAQAGTALLISDEAGTNPVHRQALRDRQFTETVVTRAFSGRYARGLGNAFIAEYGGAAPSGYPQVHQLTSPIRAAAVAAGDPQVVSLWAGTAWQDITSGPAAGIVAALCAG